MKLLNLESLERTPPSMIPALISAANVAVRSRRATPTTANSSGNRPLRYDLPRACLGHDLSVLHDESVSSEIEAVIRGLGPPDQVGGVALDVLSEHLKGHPRLCELFEQSCEESPNRGRTV